MSRPDFLVFGAPLIEQAEIDEVVATLRSGWLGTGPKTARFEEDFARYKYGGAGLERGAAAVSSCTAALHLSLLCAGVGDGDEVITTPLTFCSTVNTILHAGAKPVLADVDPLTQNIDPARIEERITPRTKAILPVHFAGRLCDMTAIMDIARRHGLKVIEDCAHAIETFGPEGRAGTIGDFGCFSFYVTKNVATGEGGMILAREPEDLEKVRRLRLHGLSRDAWNRFGKEGYKHYQVTDLGFKYNLTDLQAAIGLHQLRRVEDCWTKRRTIWQRYDQALQGYGFTRPAPDAPGTRHAYHLYTILIDEVACGVGRDSVLEEMTRRNIGVGVHYLSIADHPFYQDALGMDPAETPNATRIGRQTVSLPLSARMSLEDVEDVVWAVDDLFGASPRALAV